LTQIFEYAVPWCQKLQLWGLQFTEPAFLTQKLSENGLWGQKIRLCGSESEANPQTRDFWHKIN